MGIVTLVFPCIGSISSVSTLGEPAIGRLATAMAEGFDNYGPLSNTAAYVVLLPTQPLASSIHRMPVCLGLPWDFCLPRDCSKHHSTLIVAIDFFEPHGSRYIEHPRGRRIQFPGHHGLVIRQTAPWPVDHYPSPFRWLHLNICVFRSRRQMKLWCVKWCGLSSTWTLNGRGSIRMRWRTSEAVM